jgi:hypothetical protein
MTCPVYCAVYCPVYCAVYCPVYCAVYCPVYCAVYCLQQPATFIKASGRGDREVDTAGTIAAMGVDKGVAKQLGLGYGMQAAAAAPKPRSSSAAAAAAAAGAQQKGSSTKGADPRAAAAAQRPQSASQKGSGKLTPIILVPSGYSALVNLYNAKQLLEGHRFVTRCVCVCGGGGGWELCAQQIC